MDMTQRERDDRQQEPEETLREVASETLLNGAREIGIRHGDDVYRLRHTRNGKLILTK